MSASGGSATITRILNSFFTSPVCTAEGTNASIAARSSSAAGCSVTATSSAASARRPACTSTVVFFWVTRTVPSRTVTVVTLPETFTMNSVPRTPAIADGVLICRSELASFFTLAMIAPAVSWPPTDVRASTATLSHRNCVSGSTRTDTVSPNCSSHEPSASVRRIVPAPRVSPARRRSTRRRGTPGPRPIRRPRCPRAAWVRRAAAAARSAGRSLPAGGPLREPGGRRVECSRGDYSRCLQPGSVPRASRATRACGRRAVRREPPVTRTAVGGILRRMEPWPGVAPFVVPS